MWIFDLNDGAFFPRNHGAPFHKNRRSTPKADLTFPPKSFFLFVVNPFLSPFNVGDSGFLITAFFMEQFCEALWWQTLATTMNVPGPPFNLPPRNTTLYLSWTLILCLSLGLLRTWRYCR